MKFVSVALEDDSVDRLHHYLTAFILFLCLLVSSKRQYIGDPINCWIPKHFTRSHREYTENYCWTENTYHVPAGADIPANITRREQSEIIYYQWVPCLLLGQLVLFQLPNILWVNWYPHTGIQIREIVESADIAATIDPLRRPKQVKIIANHLVTTFYARRKLFGGSLTLLYLIVKFLYIVNLATQFSLMVYVMGGGVPQSLIPEFLKGGGDHHNAGEKNSVGFLQDANEGSLSGHFPRVTLCDLVIREVGNLHRHTVQCVLPINRINETIYHLLFFWFAILSVISVVNFGRWMYRILCASARHNAIKTLIQDEYHQGRGCPQGECDTLDSKQTTNSGGRRGGHTVNRSDKIFATQTFLCKSFTEKVLRSDGVMLFHLLIHNAGRLITREIALYLWRYHIKRHYQTKRRREEQMQNATTGGTAEGQEPTTSTTPQEYEMIRLYGDPHHDESNDDDDDQDSILFKRTARRHTIFNME